jgi:hypothetical protein
MEINPLTGNDDSTLKNITTIIDITAMRFLKPWLYIDWIIKATDLGNKYYKAVQFEHGKINNEKLNKDDERNCRKERPKL